MALQTEDVGSTILRDLRGQRDVLEHTRDTVRTSLHELSCIGLADADVRMQLYEADGSIDRASGTLRKMVRRCARATLVRMGGD